MGLHATPMIAGNVVIVGAAFETGANPRSKINVKGYVRGFDVRTGKRLWIFRTIPSPGEFGNNTWRQDSWAYTGNTGVWAQISVDPELGLAYLPVELPTHDYYGGQRPGRQPVQREPGRRRSADRRAQVALPVRAPRRVGHGHPVRADPRRRRHRRQAAQDRRAADQAGVPLRLRSRDRRADLADRGTGGAQGRCARRTLLADAAVPDQAAGLRSAGVRRRRPDRLHARAAQGRRGGDRALPDRADVHAAVGEQEGGADRHADDGRAGRGDQLARRLVRPRDRDPLRGVAELAGGDWDWFRRLQARPICRITRAPC